MHIKIQNQVNQKGFETCLDGGNFEAINFISRACYYRIFDWK